jgi:hypothetical protein
MLTCLSRANAIFSIFGAHALRPAIGFWNILLGTCCLWRGFASGYRAEDVYVLSALYEFSAMIT